MRSLCLSQEPLFLAQLAAAQLRLVLATPELCLMLADQAQPGVQPDCAGGFASAMGAASVRAKCFSRVAACVARLQVALSSLPSAPGSGWQDQMLLQPTTFPFIYRHLLLLWAVAPVVLTQPDLLAAVEGVIGHLDGASRAGPLAKVIQALAGALRRVPAAGLPDPVFLLHGGLNWAL